MFFTNASEDNSFAQAPEMLLARQCPLRPDFAGRFALTLEKACLEAKPLVAVPTLSLTIAPPQFQTTADGMGEEMIRSDCEDLIGETD